MRESLREALVEFGWFAGFTDSATTAKYKGIDRGSDGKWLAPQIGSRPKDSEIPEWLSAGARVMQSTMARFGKQSSDLDSLIRYVQIRTGANDDEVRAAWSDLGNLYREWEEGETTRVLSDGALYINEDDSVWLDTAKARELVMNSGASFVSKALVLGNLRQIQANIATAKIGAYAAASSAVATTGKGGDYLLGWGLGSKAVEGFDEPDLWAQKNNRQDIGSPQFVLDYEKDVFGRASGPKEKMWGLAGKALIGPSKIATSLLGLGGAMGIDSLGQLAAQGSEAADMINRGLPSTGMIGTLLEEAPMIAFQILVTRGLGAGTAALSGSAKAGQVAGTLGSFATAGAQSAGLTYGDELAAGTPKAEAQLKAFRAGVNTTIITAAFGSGALGGVERAAAGGLAGTTLRDLAEIASKQGVASLAKSPALRDFAKEILLSAGGEATEEGLDQLLGQFLNADPNTNLADAWSQAVEAAKTGAFISGAVHVASGGAHGGDSESPTGAAAPAANPEAADAGDHRATQAGIAALQANLQTAGIEVREELDRRSERLWDSISAPAEPPAPPSDSAAVPADPAAAAAAAMERQAAGLPVMTSREDGRVQIDYPDRVSELLPAQEESREAIRQWEDNRSATVTGEIRASLDSLKQGPGETPGTTVPPDADPSSQAAQAGKSEATGQRVRIAGRQIVADLKLDAADLEQMPVLGSSPETYEKSTRSIVKNIVRGAEPLAAIREAAGGIGRWLMDSPKIGRDRIVHWIRETEVRSGERIIAPDFANMDQAAQAQEIAGAWSHLAQANVTGSVPDSALPAPLKSFFRAFKEFTGNALGQAVERGAKGGKPRPYSGSAKAELERSATDPDRQGDGEAADSPGNVFGITYSPIPRDVLPDWGRRAVDATELAASKYSKRRRKVSAVQLGIENRPGQNDTLGFAQAFLHVFRKRVRLVKTADGESLPFDGLVNPDDPGTIIIDADSRQGFSYLLGHEVGHSIQHQRPDLYDAFQKEILGMVEDWSDYREMLHRSDYDTEAKQDAEFVNDFVGSQMHEPEFWNRLKQRNPGVFTRLVDSALDFLKTIGNRIGILQRDVRPYFKDIEKARMALVEMLEEYQRGAMPDRSVRKPELGEAPDNELSASRGRSNLERPDQGQANGGENTERSIPWEERGLSFDDYRTSLRTKPTPRNTPQDFFEIEHTGSLNYLLEGGGEEFWSDNIRNDGMILEAKMVVNAPKSLFIPGSKAFEPARRNALLEAEEAFRRMSAIVADPANPLTGVEVIVNDPAANEYFLELLRKYRLNGRIVNP